MVGINSAQTGDANLTDRPTEMQMLYGGLRGGGKHFRMMQEIEERIKQMRRRKPLHDYPVDPKVVQQLENNFTYHRPINNQSERYERIREDAKVLAFLLVRNVPPSRELSLALTNLEQAVFWANAGIARNEVPPDGE